MPRCGERREKQSRNISRNFIQTITMRLAASMVLLVASRTMNCPRKKNEDESIRTKSFLKPSDRRKRLLTRWRNTLCLPLLTSKSLHSLFSTSRHQFKRQWMPLRKNLPFLFLHLSDKRFDERNGQQTSMMLSRLL